MLNYDEIVTQTNDHRALLLANAEQQRLAQTLAPRQPHPVMAWIGRRLIRWGEQLQGETALSALPSPTVTGSHSIS